MLIYFPLNLKQTLSLFLPISFLQEREPLSIPKFTFNILMYLMELSCLYQLKVELMLDYLGFALIILTSTLLNV